MFYCTASLHFVFVQQHVRHSAADRVDLVCVWALELTLNHLNLKA